jgi:hypothetical protein
MPSPERIERPGIPLPEPKPPSLLGEDPHSRQWAVAYLLAAAKTTDLAERNSLRREAAELILPRRCPAGRLRAEIRKAC